MKKKAKSTAIKTTFESKSLPIGSIERELDKMDDEKATEDCEEVANLSVSPSRRNCKRMR